jgi:two-component system response regulator FixJ
MPNEDLVHIIDDDEAVRESVAFLLDSAGIRSRAYASAEQFLSSFSAESTGCIITDVRMPGTTGIDLLRRLAELGSTVPAIVITGHADVPLAVEAMRLGAVDFLEKPFDDESLIVSVRSALSRARQGDRTEAERAAANSRIATLSPRERDVLEGLVAGKPNKMIAFDLGISARTVEVYRANVMTKTQAASLSELVRMALIASGFRAGS